jgi:hypothetical protein
MSNATTALSTTTDAEIVDERTGEIAELPMNDDPLFTGIAAAPFSETAAKVLTAPVDESLVRIRPDGIVFLPGVMYRRILNQAFGPGAWAMRPIEARVIKEDGLVVYTAALVVMGRFVSQATGEHRYVASNGNSSYATSLESAKTDCLGRCCKDLGIATELWDNEWVERWKKKYAVAVWCENISKKDNAGVKPGDVKKLWRKADGAPFDYPWRESGAAASTSAPAESSGAWEDFVMPFGKHKGTKLGELDAGYIGWLTENWEPKGQRGDSHIQACIAAHRTARTTGEPVAKVDEPKRIDPPKETTAKPALPPRPWSAEDAAAGIMKAAEVFARKMGEGESTPEDHKKLGIACTNLGLGHDVRAKLIRYVFDAESAKDLAACEIAAVIHWVAATKDETGAYVPNMDSVDEARAIIAAHDAEIGSVIGDGLDAMGQPIGEATEEVAS